MSEDIPTPSPDEVDEALNPPDVQDGDNSTPESDIESADPSEHSDGESRISSGSGEETKPTAMKKHVFRYVLVAYSCRGGCRIRSCDSLTSVRFRGWLGVI